MSNPKFWEMIEASRKNPKMYSMDEMREYFAGKDASAGGTKKGRGQHKTPPNKALQRTGRKPSRR